MGGCQAAIFPFNSETSAGIFTRLIVFFAAFIESRSVGQYQPSSLHYHGIFHMPGGLYCQSPY